MRIKSVIDAAKGVYACGASHLNLHRTNAYHPRHPDTPQTLFYLHPPITQKHSTITPHMDKNQVHFQCDRGDELGDEFGYPDASHIQNHPLDKPRFMWYNIAVVSSKET